MLTLQEFADRLHVGKTTAWKIVSTGQVQSFRVGKVLRIPDSSARAYISNHTAQSTIYVPEVR